MSKKFTVDFIGVGTPKCGTTWLFEVLENHPDIFMPKRKELDFFLDKRTTYAKHYKRPTKPHTLKEYKDYFRKCGQKIKGEYSPRYIYDKHALCKIKKLFPNVKIILALRNPIDMLNSGYWHSRSSRDFEDTSQNITEALATKDTKQLYNKKYGHLYPYVKNCFTIFNKENIHVVFFKVIKSNPRDVATALYNFLGVNPSFEPYALSKKTNATKLTRFPIVAKLAKLVFLGISKNKQIFKVFDFINQNNRFYNIYAKFFKRNVTYPKMPAELEAILEEEFKSDIIQLEKLLGVKNKI